MLEAIGANEASQLLPLSKLQSQWNIGFSVHQIAVIKSGADGSMSHHLIFSSVEAKFSKYF